MFTWIPIHREAIRRILEYRQKQSDLLAVLHEMEQQGLKVISLQDEGSDGKTIPLAEIDPFSFLASFNRGVSDKNRRENWSFLKARWGLKAPVPDDFTGIPLLHNMTSRLFPYARQREKDHVGLLWQVAALTSDGGIENVDEELFNRCINLETVGIRRLTICIFWINPEKFLAADSKTTAYTKNKGVLETPNNYQSYANWLKEVTERLGRNYAQVSHDAHLFATQEPPSKTVGVGLGYPFNVIFASRTEAESAFDLLKWTITKLGVSQEAAQDDERIALTLPKGDPHKMRLNFGNWAILTFRLSEAGQRRVQFLCRKDNVPESAENHPDSDFADMIEGSAFTLARVPPNLIQDETSPVRRAFEESLIQAGRRFERWNGSRWRDLHQPELLKMVFDDAERDRLLREGLTSLPTPVDDEPDPPTMRCWWLNANPKIWNFEETPVGQKQSYTSHNEKGHKRQKYRYFQEVKPGDMVLGYLTSPQKEVVALCRITKGLHQTENGEGIEFEKVEQFAKPVAYETLQANPDLASSEPLISNQGSLFKLSIQEYEIIRSLIDETNLQVPTKIEYYDKKKAMKGLFLAEAQFDEMLAALIEKKNVVLQGAPGVGKTYVARRLAYALIESNDPQRIEMIQFHQSYSYEDFIQGFRPTPKGHFDLKCGIFHQFCRRAQRDEAEGKPYVFIIDEINRGNLSKIFGELMMLIEPDKRGKEHAIPLAYCQDADEKFYIPDNLHLIGMMNTADRSLALVDYALRRRFRFITLRPEFSSEVFAGFLADCGAQPELAKKIIAGMTALNEVIAADAKNLGPGYQIGHSYFCPRKGIRPDDGWYRRVIEAEIVPLIQEYWFDNDEKVKEQRSALLA